MSPGLRCRRIKCLMRCLGSESVWILEKLVTRMSEDENGGGDGA